MFPIWISLSDAPVPRSYYSTFQRRRACAVSGPAACREESAAAARPIERPSRAGTPAARKIAIGDCAFGAFWFISAVSVNPRPRPPPSARIQPPVLSTRGNLPVDRDARATRHLPRVRSIVLSATETSIRSVEQLEAPGNLAVPGGVAVTGSRAGRSECGSAPFLPGDLKVARKTSLEQS